MQIHSYFVQKAFYDISLERMRLIIESMLSYYLVSQYIEIEIHLLKSIRKFNMNYRNKDYDTDIISLQFEENIYITCPIMLGVIFLSEDIIKSKYKQYSNDYIWYIMIHGLLHLCNFDHVCKKDFIKMRYEEQKWIKEFNINEKVNTIYI